jgi:DnaJ-class molecular chaperone
MAEDPYKVLGLEKTASDDEVRRAFRKLAKQYHPDLHPGDKAAAEQFKTVSAAYDVVGDAEKRKKYDRGEIDAAGEPRRGFERQYAGAGQGGARTFSEGDFGIGDIFSDLFGARGPRGPGAGFSLRGQDVRYTLEVDFLEAVGGARKRVTLPEGGTLDLTVPEGVADGQVLRLKGKGAPGLRGGESGDALIEIRIRPHAQFKRQGDDILLEIPITIDEAVLGAKIEVPTISGRVAVQVPKATSSGRVFRLKGKGVRNQGLNTTGDQLVTVRIVLPETIDDSLAYFLSEWRQKHGYDPGRTS